jgi:hypothetical protein
MHGITAGVFLFVSKDPNSKDLKNSRGEEPENDPVGVDPQSVAEGTNLKYIAFLLSTFLLERSVLFIAVSNHRKRFR